MDMLNGLPVLKISVDKLHQGVDKISLVDYPAIEEDFIAFRGLEDDDQEEYKYDFLEHDQQKLAGPFLIPNRPILREHPKTKQRFYVVFPPEVIQVIADRFNENLHGGSFNLDHEKDVKGVYVAENWIIDNPKHDKSFYKFGKQYPAGTWYGVVKVKSKRLWEKKIKTGEYRGFSVELLAGMKLAMDTALLEEHALSVMDGLGEKVGPNWKLLHSEEIAENEAELTPDEIYGKLDFAISAKPGEDSNLDRDKADGTGRWIVRYRYTGPLDGKNRNFCRRVLLYQNRTGKIFRKEDINQMSFRSENSEFGTYSIFNYKGSYGCRHKWTREIYFIDFEDDETRRVGNVPQVTSRADDSQAREVNPKPKRTNLKTIDKMSETKSKFALLEELPVEERIVGAPVDNEDGQYEVEGYMYVVADGVITEVMEPATEEAPAEVVTEDPGDIDAWKAEVMAKLAELEARVEQIMADMNGADASSAEQFKGINLDELVNKFKAELLPALEKKTDEPNVEEAVVELSQAQLAVKAIEALRIKQSKK